MTTLNDVCDKLDRIHAWNHRPFSRDPYWVVARDYDEYILYCKQLWIDPVICKYIPSTLPDFILDGIPSESILYAYGCQHYRQQPQTDSD